ncbi:MAG TPA: ribosome biogenesis GTPase Der [Labilithrix sp.]|nr:ribosome biogenesis GTPase Der [Labilithrix sp.]
MTKHHAQHVSRVLPAGAHGLPLVAIVGRPNVGKSTLFNRLARRRVAIVHDEPGVTRDRNYTDTTAFGRDYTLVDTGGFDPDSDDPMKNGITRHVKSAIEEADVIVFVSDAMVPLTSADRVAVGLLRKTTKPVLFAANKADSPRNDADAFEIYRLGVDKVFPVSGLHGRGIGDLEAAIIAAMPDNKETEEVDEFLPRIAIVGKPNAGKSSLMNRILGEERMIVDSRPGTTRDAIDALVARGDKRYIFVDTAGLRRKGKVTKAFDEIEFASIGSAVRAVERSSVVVLLCDAKEGVAEQDAKILGLAADRGRGMIIALNKADLLSKDELKKAEDAAREKISFAPFAPIVVVSAKTGRGLTDVFEAIDKVSASFHQRIGTGALNRFFEQVLQTRPPPTMGGSAPRLYYITQAETSPPVFVILASAPDSVHFSYQRFVANQLRKAFGFDGVPIRIVYRERRRGGRGARKEGELIDAAKADSVAAAAATAAAPRRPRRVDPVVVDDHEMDAKPVTSPDAKVAKARAAKTERAAKGAAARAPRGGAAKRPPARPARPAAAAAPAAKGRSGRTVPAAAARTQAARDKRRKQQR